MCDTLSSSTASISSSPAAVCSPAPKSRLLRNHRSLPRRVSWLVRKPEKVHYGRKQRVKGEGKRRRKTTSRIIKLRKGGLPSPLSPSHSPFASTLPHVKCSSAAASLIISPAPHCLPKQAKVKRDVLPRQDHFVTLWLGSNRVSAKIFLKVPSRFAIGTGRTENETENQFSVCRTNFRFAHVRVYFDPAHSKPWRGPFRKSNRFGLQNLPNIP